MNGHLQKLQTEVVEYGQHFHDYQKIPSGVYFDAPKQGILKLQILQDAMRKYKYYDALGMWLGNEECWNKSEQAFLKILAEEYLERQIR